MQHGPRIYLNQRISIEPGAPMRTFEHLAAVLCLVVGLQAAVVRPVFTSTPSLAASQDVAYTYTVMASTPDHEAITFLLHGPVGATLVGGNKVTWTPSATEARKTNSFSITATSASGGKTIQTFRIVPTGTISGTRIDHYLNGATVPEDLSTAQVAAFAPDANGGYNRIAGTGTKSGTFTINNVPGGFYLLGLGNFYLWTNSNTMHVDPYADTRPNPTQADPSTTLTFDLTNVNAWQSADTLEMFSANNGAFLSFGEADGAKTFTGTYQYGDALSNAALGDRYYVTQLITQPVGGSSFVALGRYFAVPKFTQANGSDTPINGAMQTIAQTQQFEANINAGDITTAADAVNANGTLSDTSLFLDAFPGSLGNGVATASPDLLGYSLGNGLPFLTTNTNFGPVFYGNPFPATWPLFTGYIWSVNVPYVAPGATTGTTLFGSVYGFGTTLPTSTQPLTLLVNGPSAPTVNGHNFSSNLSGIGLTPKLAWSAPSVGKASYYQLYLWRLTKSGTRTAETLFATMQTSATSLTLPPGLLTTGDAYVFDLWAYTVQGYNVVQPLKFRLPYGAADVMSGVMQP
jgi:hypothetical protein